MPNTREKLIDIVEAYADFLDWDTKEDMVDSIMKFLATDNNVGHKWIPVTERLPEMWQNVLTVRTDGKFRFDFVGSLGVWYEDVNFVGYPVTHWMPLPTPPKGE